jgi:ATP-dependent phosphofructokinase / diphosphate-dependent phosphofructokinase
MRGNVLIAQSGGPTAVINSSCCGIIQEVVKQKDKFKTIYGAVNGILGVLNEDLVNLSKEDASTIELLKQTPSSALGSCRYKLSDEDYDRVIEVIEAHNIHYCFFIGGNDTMDTANKVDQLLKERNWEACLVGIPKTVDNDLVGTDHCPGYPSAAKWLAIAVRDAGLDTKAIYTSDTIKIIETMGRDSGWLAAATALARDNDLSPPHLIYVPERLLNLDKFLADVENVHNKLGYVVIAVSEGLRGEDGILLVESKSKLDIDAFGHGQRGGVADYLCHLIADNLNLKARFDKPGTIQRVSMVCASEIDLKEAYEVGRKAVREALSGKSGNMITLLRGAGDKYKCSTGTIALNEVANKTRSLPDIFINQPGNAVTKEFIDWLTPLLGSPLMEYAHMKRIPVKKKLGGYYQ